MEIVIPPFQNTAGRAKLSDLDFLFNLSHMQDIWCLLISIAIVVWATCLVAFPHLVTPNFNNKKKKFHGYHWGAYDGSPPDEASEEDEGVEASAPTRKGPHVTGSRTYAYGKGISFRG